MNEPVESTASPARNKWKWLRLACFAAIVLASAYFVAANREQFSLQSLADRQETFEEYQRAHPVLVYGVAAGLYVLVTAFSIPVATPMSLICAWLFGFWRALVLVSFSSTAGATLAFLMSRYLLRDVILGRFGTRLDGFNAALEREGAFYLFALRLTPAVPFFVINAVMGLTRLRVWTFWWVSQVGMLAGTAVYVYAGSQLPDLQTLADEGTSGILTPGLVGAFLLLGVFPLVVRRVMGRLGGVTREGTGR